MSDDPSSSAPPDAKPLPPREPYADECCGNGCVPCVYDLYWDAVARYEAALEQWQLRQDSNNVSR